MNFTLTLDETQRQSGGLARISLTGDEINDIELDLPFKELYRSIGTPDPMALELLMVASGCYAIDKSVNRRLSSDVWTRKLSVSFPVTDPKRWSKVAARLDTGLTFLSGDVWRTSFHAETAKLFVAPKLRRRRQSAAPTEPSQFHAVCLFSGGLDSLIGAIDFLEQHPKSNLTLIGHYDFPGPKSQQKGLYESLKAKYPGRTKLIQVRISQRPTETAETTLRSRSIIFLALGLSVASNTNTTAPLLAPENGLIALNLPLTASRNGSCSTRTMHPFYLNTLRSVVQDLGIKNMILNPLELKTKADCVSECRNAPLLSALASRSVSCSHGTRRQEWKRRNVGNCGYCIPCLFRRAALHAAGVDVGSEYGFDVCADELAVTSDLTSSDDLRALINGMHRLKTNVEIRKAITSVAGVEPLTDYIALVNRGLSQIRTWIKDKGSASFRKDSGITAT